MNIAVKALDLGAANLKGSAYALKRVGHDVHLVDRGCVLGLRKTEPVVGQQRTLQSLKLMAYLMANGVPVAPAHVLERQPTALAQVGCTMLPVFIEARTARYGELLERCPGEKPGWNREVAVQFFGKGIFDPETKSLHTNVKGGVEEDDVFRPLLRHASENTWMVLARDAPGGVLGSVTLNRVTYDEMALMRQVSRKAYGLLEAGVARAGTALNMPGLRLGWARFEFGRRHDTGELVLAGTLTMDDVAVFSDKVTPALNEPEFGAVAWTSGAFARENYALFTQVCAAMTK